MNRGVFYLILLTGLIFAGCTHTTELIGDDSPDHRADLNYSVIYYIHADADYLYHTPEGDAVEGNTKILATAMNVGVKARSGEVLIYYQRPEKKILGMIPRKSSRFIHYLRGEMVRHVKYRHPDKNEPFLTTETELMNHYSDLSRSGHSSRYFLFFGHEIPMENGRGYHHTLPDIDVNTASFSRGIQNFLFSDEEVYDLVVLSTCNNGTPSMAEALRPFTHAMLASPQNLHLSHIDTESMALLEMKPGIPPLQLGRSMGDRTFERLKETVHTTITLALYDFEKLRDSVRPFATFTSNQNQGRPNLFQDNVDCAELSSIEFENTLHGVDTWYRPGRFGRVSVQSVHSGWGCKPGSEI